MSGSLGHEAQFEFTGMKPIHNLGREAHPQACVPICDGGRQKGPYNVNGQRALEQLGDDMVVEKLDRDYPKDISSID